MVLKIKCECGSIVAFRNALEHFSTKKHKNYFKNDKYLESLSKEQLINLIKNNGKVKCNIELVNIICK